MNKIWSVPLSVGLLLAAAGPSRADDQAEAKALVEKAIKAMGGADNLAKFKSISLKGKGTVYEPGKVAFTEQSMSQQVDRYRFELELNVDCNKIQEIIVVNDDKGWIKIADTVQEMPKELVGAFKDYFYALRLASVPVDLLEKDVKLSPLGEMKIGDRLAVGLLVSRKGRRDVNLYFDKETSLPVKGEITARDIEADQEVSHEFLFSEYKEFDGVKAYTQMVWNKNGKKYLDRELTELKPEEKLDDSLFGKP
jgi:hypothetical protein